MKFNKFYWNNDNSISLVIFQRIQYYIIQLDKAETIGTTEVCVFVIFEQKKT